MKPERGQTTVEFALVFVTLLLFLVGTLDFGRAVYYYNVIGEASRAGARRASVTTEADFSLPGNAPGTYSSTAPYVGTSTIMGVVAANAAGLDTGALAASISTPMGFASGFELPVNVATQYVYRPLAGTLLGVSTITVTAQSTMHLR